jgi:hypothetical protein
MQLFFLRAMMHESTRRGANVQPLTVLVNGCITSPRLIEELAPIWVNWRKAGRNREAATRRRVVPSPYPHFTE